MLCLPLCCGPLRSWGHTPPAESWCPHHKSSSRQPRQPGRLLPLLRYTFFKVVQRGESLTDPRAAAAASVCWSADNHYRHIPQGTNTRDWDGCTLQEEQSRAEQVNSVSALESETVQAEHRVNRKCPRKNGGGNSTTLWFPPSQQKSQNEWG